MSCLVGDDVVRETREHDLARQVGAGIVLGGLEVTEQERVEPRVVISVGLLHGVGKYPEQPVVWGGGRSKVRPPPDLSTQRRLDSANRVHDDGINHLLVELRIGLRWRQAILT